MSRSYRKSYWTQGYGDQWRRFAKRQASKRVRQSTLVGKAAYYQRLYNSWDIRFFPLLFFAIDIGTSCSGNIIRDFPSYARAIRRQGKK